MATRVSYQTTDFVTRLRRADAGGLHAPWKGGDAMIDERHYPAMVILAFVLFAAVGVPLLKLAEVYIPWLHR